MTDHEAMAALYRRLEKVIAPESWEDMAVDIMAIRALKKEKNAVILAHNYMTPEVYFGVADVTGDSLALAREAAKMQADVIVCAGVHFMAETAKLMNPSRIVLSPDLAAGCSLADSITPQDVRALRAKYPARPIITYVNTSAAVKAECDICCTSGNAKKIVESLGVSEVVMVPDEYLAQNVARQTSVKVIPWHGHCEVHEQYAPQEVAAIRRENPAITIIAHPECPPDVVAQADFAGSTVNMSDWVAAHHPRQVMLLTERSMSDNAAVDHPDIDFVRPRLPCPYMKLITLKSIRRSLETMTHAVEIDEVIASPARRAVERMMAVK